MLTENINCLSTFKNLPHVITDFLYKSLARYQLSYCKQKCFMQNGCNSGTRFAQSESDICSANGNEQEQCPRDEPLPSRFLYKTFLESESYNDLLGLIPKDPNQVID